MHYQPNPQLVSGKLRGLLLRRPFTVLVAVALVAALVGGSVVAPLLGVGAPQPRGGAAQGASGASLTITAAAARETSWPLWVGASGAIVPWQEAIIGSPLAGLPVVALDADVGDIVTRGQILARLESDTLRAEEAELLAGVAEARANLAANGANRDRAVAMGRTKALSEQEILQAVTRAETARAKLASAEARLASKRVQLGHTEIRAPDDGVISSRHATLGTVAGTGQELFRLIRQNRLEWRGELNAAQVGLVAVDQIATLRLPDGSEAQGRIRQVAPAMDGESRLASLYVDLEPGSSARAGMYVDARIALDEAPALVVPARSIVISDGHSYVFLVDGDGPLARVDRQRVAVGRRQGDQVEVLAGLIPGQRVAVDGAGFLADGDRVRIASDPPGESAP